MSNRQMHFKLDSKNTSSPDFLLFMSQSELQINFDSEKNEITVEIPKEIPEEIEKLIKTIAKCFDIQTFSSGNSINLSEEQEYETSNIANSLSFDFSFLSEECSSTRFSIYNILYLN